MADETRLSPEWRERFLAVLHLMQVRIAAAGLLLGDHGGAAAEAGKALVAARRARDLFQGPHGFIPEGASPEERKRTADALEALVVAAERAVEATTAFAGKDRPERRPKGVRNVKRASGPKEVIQVVAPQEFVWQVFRRYPDAPTNPTAWAHFAVDAGITPTPKRGGWATPIASWNTAIQRHLKSRR